MHNFTTLNTVNIPKLRFVVNVMSAFQNGNTERDQVHILVFVNEYVY